MNMNSTMSTECKILIDRLKTCDLEAILRNPSNMLKFYPIRNPDNESSIFEEVYPLINKDLLKKSYKFRFFYFLDTFLSSTKVPAYIIAAYLKQLARLTLFAQPKSLVLILRLTSNLFLRHPTLIRLRDKVDDRARELELKSDTCTLRDWLEADPFNPNQKSDLKASNGLDSCVWELMPLRFHEHPKVAKEARFLSETNIPEIECDLGDLVT